MVSKWSDLIFWISNYAAHEGFHIWLPYEKELKMNYLNPWDIQQVDNSMYSRIGQHSTTTRTTYMLMKLSATEYRMGLLLQLCVQWTPNSTGMHHYRYSVIIYLQPHYGFLGCDICKCRWIQVSRRNMPTKSSGWKWKEKMWSGYISMWHWRCWLRSKGGPWNLGTHDSLKPQSKN